MACGNSEVDRELIRAIGRLAVKAAIENTSSRAEALARVLGRHVVTSEPKKYFVLRDGSRVESTNTEDDGQQHVHVVREHQGQPNTAMVQITDRTRKRESFLEGPRLHRGDGEETTIPLFKEGERKGHFERVEVWTPNRPLSDADLRAEELALVEKMNSRIRQGRRK